MVQEEAKARTSNIQGIKRIIADTFKKVGLIDETYTGEVTVGINDGGIMFIRKSETLK